MIADAISFVLGNGFIVLFAIALCATIAKVRRLRRNGRVAGVATILWAEVLFYNVGIGFIYVGFMHAYFQQLTAPNIGWQPSPFEYELGWMEIALGLVAVLALRRGFEFRLAATIVFVIFSLAAAAQHIQEILCCKNFAPGNAGLTLWFADIFVPLVLVVAAALSNSERPS